MIFVFENQFCIKKKIEIKKVIFYDKHVKTVISRGLRLNCLDETKFLLQRGERILE